MSESNDGLDIAIIGMAGKFPGADNIDEFWELLKNGVEAVTFFSDEELLESGIDPSLINDPNYVKSRAVIKDEDKFDAAFFDFFPREVEMMDPQHRLFLETAWAALENAGYYADNFDGLIGLFGGVSLNTYLYAYIMSQKGFISSAEGYQLSIGNDKDFLTTRVSYKMNLKGPSVDVQTACSTSLVAVHLACQNLLNYNCDMAMAGGVSITVPQKQGYYYQEGMILSRDGHCRAFDHKASGTISGSGVGIVVLKRLDEALEDGDFIYAVIKGSAFNNDGSNRVGYTAPSVDGQSEVIANALAIANVEPETLSYIETHGTGTVLGDPIEITALTQVFREQTKKKQFCAIGSVKTNIGHLDAAAGVAGLIKTALALHYKQIPPSINFEKPNPEIDFEDSPFFVNTVLREWKTEDGSPRRAGLSSFGIGGTNVHAILEEAPELKHGAGERPAHILMLSAKSTAALDQATANLAEYLSKNPDVPIADVAYTLQTGRKPFQHRRILVCNSTREAAQALKNNDAKRILSMSHPKEPDNPPVAFMFSGQGSQYIHMAKHLYQTETVFRKEMDRCFDILKSREGLDLRSTLYPAAEDEKTATEQLNQTEFTQPALFVIEYALAKLWIHWGIEPSAMVGHSIGEYVAAHLAGVFSLEDALKVVVARGRLMQRMPAGAMVSVQLDETSIRPFLDKDLTIGALNSAGVTVLSGSFEAIGKLEERLSEKKIQFRRLHTSHAFHSAMMDPILEEFKEVIKSVKPVIPNIPYLSNTTGTWITNEQASDPEYYARHLRQGVRFADNVHTLLQEADLILLEVGPGTVLSTLARRHPSNSLGRLVLSSVRHPQDKSNDVTFILNTLGRLWMAGSRINWHHFYEGQRRLRIPLPSYPFERKRFWLHSSATRNSGSFKKEPLQEGKKSDLTNWFYIPAWKQKQLPYVPTQKPDPDSVWMIFKDATGLSTSLINTLEPLVKKVIVVNSGPAFVQRDETHFTIKIHDQDDYKRLIAVLQSQNTLPDNILHLWNVSVRTKPIPFNDAIGPAYLSLLHLVQALAFHNITQKIQLGIISNDMFEITSYERTEPVLATLHGLTKVIPQEFPNLICREIDVTLPMHFNEALEPLGQHLIREFFNTERELGVAYRGKQRWVQNYESVHLTTEDRPSAYLKGKGVYLITGGLGRIGLRLANYLSTKVKARLALIEVYDFPTSDQWDAWLKKHGADDITSIKIKRLQNIERNGSEILILKANVSDAEALKSAFDRTVSAFGEVNGLFHLAGIVGAHAFKTIPEITEQDWIDQFKAKVYGALNLVPLVDSANPDFVLLQSSISSILGGLGFGAYAAANAVLDALTFQQNKKNRAQWICVNWDGWNFDMDASPSKGLGSEIAQLAILPDEGIRAFDRILSYRELPQVIVSTGDLQTRINKWLKMETLQKAEAAPSVSSGELHSRPELANAYVAPETDLQKKVAEKWQQLLGIEPIGIYDDFFDLGGNSLMGTQLISELRDTFQIDLPLRSLFEDPTVSGVVKIIETHRQEQKDSDMAKVADLLQQMENLSEEDAKALLDKKKKK